MPTASGSLAFLGAARFQGYWNANSNNATGSGLTGGVTGQVTGLFLAGASTSNGGYALATGLTASAGDYWQVTGSGTHNVDGTTNWNLNDFCIYSGSAGGTGDWIKLAFEDTIASIVLGDLSSGSFHLGAANNKHIIFASGSVHSGSNNFVFDYDNTRVGIGTSSPTVALEIDGDIKLSPTAITTTHITTGGSMAIRANDNISIGDDDADSVRIGRTNTTLAKIHIRSGADTDLVVSDSKVGIGTDSPTFKLDVNGTTRHSDDVTVIDDKKVIFGTNSDAHIEYNENGDDNLIISGSSSGMVLSGTIVQVSGNMIVKFPNYLAVTSNDSHNASSFYVQTGQGAQFHGGTDNGGVTIRDAGDVHIADDKKIIFGTGEDSHIEYNENGDDFLIISGSHGGGTVISGSKLAFDSSTVASGTIAGPGSYLAVKSTGQVVLTSSAGGGAISTVANGANNRVATFGSADSLNGEIGLQFDGSTLDVAGDISLPDDKKLIFGTNSDASFEYDEDGTDTLLYAGASIRIPDDTKLEFGSAGDGHIEYNENGDDFLIVSGSSKGVALSGSVIALDGDTNVAGTFIADAGISGTHQLTGSLQITGSDGVSLQLKSTGSVSIRLEADSDNNDEAQNPFIEFIQDGSATDYTVGLNATGKSPEGLNISKGADNALLLGANQAPSSTAPGHIQFYTRQTASFSLLDRGSTNHGSPTDREGFRVGIGPSFNEDNFPKGRVEIHNTSDANCPALYLAVSGASQPALITEAANTTRNIVEITGSSLTTGDMMVLYSDSSNTSDRTLLNITNDNASSEKVVLVQLTQDAFSYPAFIQRGGGTVKNLPTFNTSHATSQAIAITHLIEGSYFAVGRGAGTTDTTPTSAQIVARIKDAAVGDSFEFAYFNTGLTHDVTLAGGTNVKKLDGSAASFTIPAGKGRMFVFVLMNVGSGTEQVNMIPKSAAVDLFS